MVTLSEAERQAYDANGHVTPRAPLFTRMRHGAQQLLDGDPTHLTDTQVVDYSARPIWLIRGVDRAGNDFRAGREAA